tara:strand:- start:193 stop:1383 length:1191 start_codon:yes stop_codon:yes gene_type:complete
MFDPIPDVLQSLARGEIIILVDDESRENEGDLVLAGQFATAEKINFMTRLANGYLCVALSGENCDRLDLAPQVPINTSLRSTPMTVSVDGHPRHGVGTGISASDRAATISLLSNPETRPDDFVRPGHINPLRSRPGGVLERTGQTEGSVDLCVLAGLHPAAAIIEIVKPDGSMARRKDLELLAKEHGLKMCTVDQIIEWRLAEKSLVSRSEPIEGAPVKTPWGEFNLFSFRSTIDALPHLALAKGNVGIVGKDGKPISNDAPVLVRMHRRNLLGDIFDEGEAPSGPILRSALKKISEANQGVLVYLRPEFGSDPLSSMLQRIMRQSMSFEKPDYQKYLESPEQQSQREFGVGAQILRQLGITRIRLLTNTSRHRPGLGGFGIEIIEEVSLNKEPRF